MSSTPSVYRKPAASYEAPPSAFADATGDATGVASEGANPGSAANAPSTATGNGDSGMEASHTLLRPEIHALAAPTLSEEQFARVSKALADPRRFSILEIIAAHGEIACQRLCSGLPVKQATVSHHVKELSLAGLVDTRRDGQFVYYSYVPSVARQYMATLAARLQLPPTLTGQRGEA